MSYESTKTSTNTAVSSSGGGEIMASEMSSHTAANNLYSNNNNPNRLQAMIMNPMMGTGNYFNGPPQGTPQQAQMPYRPMYQQYPPGSHHHPQHHQILSPFDTYESRTSGYYSSYSHDTGVYEHQQVSAGRHYYGNYGENQVESSPYSSKDGCLSSSSITNNNVELNATDSTTASHDQQQQGGNMAMGTAQTPPGNSNYNNSSMMPPPHPASKQQQPYANYSQQQGDMYSRTSNNGSAPQYVPQYSQYPPGSAGMMNPRSPAPNTNAYRPPYPSGSPYQNGIGSPSTTSSSGKSTCRPQQLSPKRSNSQSTTPPQQPRYPTPYPSYSNGPVAYKPGGSNGYGPPNSQQQQQQQSSWPPPPPPPVQRDVVTPGLASSTGDSDSNSSNASQQPASYSSTTLTNGPTTGGYAQSMSSAYNSSSNMNDPTNNMSTSGHPYMDSQYPNIPQPNYGYPPQQMNPYGNHPPQMHGQPTNDFRPPPIQSMDDDSNVYRNKPPLAMMIDQQQQQQSHHPTLPTSLSSQAQSISSSTNGPKSPSGTSMSSYVPDDADSSNSSFPDSPPPSHEKGQQKRKLSSATSNAHSTPAEVFTKLRDMGDESERQERYLFVERLQKLWEENQIVCRNLPSISKQTIDLYRLYTCVREQNGFQEFSKVAKNRHWRDIASKLNIPNSSSAAFNVKQKYINLKLFHYECKYDRGGISPEPILGEIEKQQGKRTKTPKKGANNSGTAANNTTDNTNDGKTASPQVHSQSQPPVLSQQQPQQPPVQDPYRGYPPPSAQSHPHQMGHPQQQYRPMQMPMHPYGTPGNEMQPSYDPSSSGPMMYSNPEMDYQRVGYPPGQQPPQMMKPPSNVYGMPPPPQSQVAQPPSSMAPQHRPPGPYPSIASKPQQQMVPSSQQDYNAPSASSVMCAPPNQHAPPTQVSQPPPPLQQQQPPTSATGPQQTYHYQPQQPMPSAYPPLGYQQPRPPMMSGPPQTHDPYLSQQVPPNQTYPNQVPPTYMYKKSENSTTDSSNLDNQDANKGNKILMNQLRSSFSNTSMLPTSTPISILTSSTTSTNATITPSSMPTTSFPPNSIEATTLSSKVKRKKLTAKDVTPVDPWKLMMSLRGGLLAETTWALDTINIMLTDDQTHTYFRLKQMPGLLQAIVDIYLKCLTQLFDEFKSSPSNIEDQQPLLKDLNGSSHLTCTTIKKHENKQQESTIYRVESNSLNKYRRKYNKEQSVVYDRVYDEQGNEKTDPTDVLDLQNTDDLSYVRTHFDPFRVDDNFYEELYYGNHTDHPLNNSYEQETTKKSQISSRKRTKISGDDDDNNNNNNNNNEAGEPVINEITPSDNSKRRRYDSDSLIEISDSNQEFLERYKRRFEYDENQTYELYSGICSSSSSSSSSMNKLNHKDFDSCTRSNDQQDNVSSLFTYHSLAYDQICARCTCVSSIIRNLSFILGNDIELVKCKTLIGLLARLLLLRHGINHNHMSDNQSSMDETVNQNQLKTDEQKCSPSFCWAECVINVRENTLVTLANIAGTLVLDTFDSDLLYTLIDGLLHWSTCYSGEAIDSLQSSLLSAQRLAIEILTKLSVHEMNMDFILATPPFYRIVSLFHVLTDWLIVDDINGGISNWHPPSLTSSTHYYTNVSRPQSHIQREFAIVLLNALVRCDSLASSVIAHIPYAISLLLNFLEDYEMKTNELMVRYGPDYVIRLTTQPSNIQHAEQILFTTGDMLKRAATCLLSIVSYSDNIKLVKRYEDRILNLSTSHVIDSNVGRVLTDVLHYCSLHNS
ncbi:unnamed protein product [Rotaria magnacalcarata]|uniref:ARID domain-containing protein n=3 Tax=Rotaria magnacalcarata TaxID=392030 RepID=A0A817AL30_9BILA|nr:unnamed protein product [Rotaria magnacalcarata]CAF3798274.1 unnamed protein product [Rotaria magnacalcarata]